MKYRIFNLFSNLINFRVFWIIKNKTTDCDSVTIRSKYVINKDKINLKKTIIRKLNIKKKISRNLKSQIFIALACEISINFSNIISKQPSKIILYSIDEHELIKKSFTNCTKLTWLESWSKVKNNTWITIWS